MSDTPVGGGSRADKPLFQEKGQRRILSAWGWALYFLGVVRRRRSLERLARRSRHQTRA